MGKPQKMVRNNLPDQPTRRIQDPTSRGLVGGRKKYLLRGHRRFCTCRGPRGQTQALECSRAQKPRVVLSGQYCSIGFRPVAFRRKRGQEEGKFL